MARPSQIAGSDWDVETGETVDLSSIPASSPATSAGSRSVPNEVRSLAGRNTDNAAAVTAVVDAFGIRDSDNIGGNLEHDGGVRRVHFVDEYGEELGGCRGYGQADRDSTHEEDREGGEEGSAEEESDEDEGDEDEEEEERDRRRVEGRAEVVRILWERFLAGDERGVDYKNVDGDLRLDDLDQLARDEVGQLKYGCFDLTQVKIFPWVRSDQPR